MMMADPAKILEWVLGVLMKERMIVSWYDVKMVRKLGKEQHGLGTKDVYIKRIENFRPRLSICRSNSSSDCC